MSNPSNLVILSSGWTKPNMLFTAMARRFQNEGFDVLITSYPDRGFGSIEESCSTIAPALQAVREEYDHITFIGHSMGGLIGRSLVQQCLSPLDAFVSVATPHNGSHLARLAPWSQSAKQMCVGSSFLSDLNQLAWPGTIPALALQAGLEQVIWPRKSALIDFGENVLIPWVDHGTIILSERCFWEIWSWLKFTMRLKTVGIGVTGHLLA